MKKTLLSTLMLSAFGIFTANAQITITDANLASIGDNVEQARDTLPTGISIGPSGASQTWNFSAVAEDELDTLKFRAPAGYPLASDFPLSNMVIVDPPLDSSWTYLTKTSVGLFIDGQAMYNQGNLISVPFAATIITFPSTMGTSFSGPWTGTLGGFDVSAIPFLGLDSLKITRGSNTNSNIDAWGNVTTPFSTFPSLRQIVITESIDTTWEKSTATGTWSIVTPATIAALGGFGVTVTEYAYDTTRTARWWTDDVNAKFPVIEMDYEANGDVNSVDWLKTAISVNVTEVNTAHNISLYPNPASTEITIESSLKNNSSVSILDVTGKLVKTIRFTTNKLNIPVTDLDNGIYFYNVYDVNGNILHSNKFVIAK